ncbi:unnamed protein product [Calypogeia fissa]
MWVEEKFQQKVHKATICRLLKQSFPLLSNVTGNTMKRSKTPKCSIVEEALHRWFLSAHEAKLPIFDDILIEKAKVVYTIVLKKNPSEKECKFSNGWLVGFKKCHNIKMRVMHGTGEAKCNPVQNVNGKVELLGVSFRYDESSPWVLRNVNLYARPGETVALVGASGGGKTNLAKLLLHLYDPIYGNIIIDGQDIRSLSLKSLRKQVAIVPQETTLFTGTVAENIAYGQLSAKVDINAVKSAAQLANADAFIQKLSDGYATNLGDRASSLSGGQRQRLAIATALYQEATILILDEATSALDNKSEILSKTL